MILYSIISVKPLVDKSLNAAKIELLENWVMVKKEMQNEIIKRMSPQQKLEASMDLYYSARKLKAAWLRQLHSDWSDKQVAQAVTEAFVNARS